MRNRVGKSWHYIKGPKLTQIDSGTFGIVWAVTRNQKIFCRIGITWSNPKGKGWRRVPGQVKSVSVGLYGVWAINRYQRIYYRSGVTRRRPQGIYYQIETKKYVFL